MSAWAILALAVVALIAWASLRRLEKAGALPPGSVTYADTDQRRPGETLVSHRYALAGRPDYVAQTSEGAIPVEVKSRSCGGKGPYPSETAQLFAYCLLVEDVMGEPVREGRLQFPDQTWAVAFGADQRRMILAVLDEMRHAQGAPNVQRNHTHAGKCRGCGFRAPNVCGQALPRG
jgi:CRISPR-associated exonuclease Cas4